MNFRQFKEFINNPEIYKFLTISIFGAISVLLLTILFTSFFGIYYVISTTIAFEFTVIWTFFVNDKWTFSQVHKITKPFFRLIKYNLFYLISLGIIQLVMIALTEHGGLHYTLSQSIAIVSAFFFNYLMSKKISFKN